MMFDPHVFDSEQEMLSVMAGRYLRASPGYRKVEFYSRLILAFLNVMDRGSHSRTSGTKTYSSKAAEPWSS